ncbi:SHOCT domain-containing protein [Chloroflexota bacterium]
MWFLQEGMGSWMIFGVIAMVVLWVLLLALVLWGIKRLAEYGGSGPSTTEKHDPLDIARERYARGDISREEFEQIKKDLS